MYHASTAQMGRPPSLVFEARRIQDRTYHLDFQPKQYAISDVQKVTKMRLVRHSNPEKLDLDTEFLKVKRRKLWVTQEEEN